MFDQAKIKPYAASGFYRDSIAARMPVAGTVPHGDPRIDSFFYYGRENGKLAADFPMPVTMKTLERGQLEFNIYCSPCHGRLGDARGMIVQRGFPQPPSYHIQRLRDAPPGHFFDVMTRGLGKMYDYSERVQPADRWAIAAYIKALQLSQHTPVSMMAEEDKRKMNINELQQGK